MSAHASWVLDTSLQAGVIYISITTSSHALLNLSTQAGIVSIMSSNNNTILTLSDMDGHVQSCISAGALGFTNSRKATSQAAEAVGEAMAEKVCAESFSSATLPWSVLGCVVAAGIAAATGLHCCCHPSLLCIPPHAFS